MMKPNPLAKMLRAAMPAPQPAPQPKLQPKPSAAASHPLRNLKQFAHPKKGQ